MKYRLKDTKRGTLGGKFVTGTLPDGLVHLFYVVESGPNKGKYQTSGYDRRTIDPKDVGETNRPISCMDCYAIIERGERDGLVLVPDTEK